MTGGGLIEGKERMVENGASERPDTAYSKSLMVGLATLKVFSPDRQVMGVADIADMVGVPRSTAHRYATTLVELGYLEQNTQRKYRLGLRVADLGLAAVLAAPLRKRSQPELERLAAKTGLPTTLAVLDGREGVVVARALGARSRPYPEALTAPGTRLPLHSTAPGKILLAGVSEGRREETLAGLTFTGGGPNVITTVKEVRVELDGVAIEGMAVDDQESASGVQGVAVAVRGEDGEVLAALALAAERDVARIDEMVTSWLSAMETAAARIAAVT